MMRIRGMECRSESGYAEAFFAPKDRLLVDAAMKVLVTGHHGYIGSVLAPLVAEAGHDVDGPRCVSLPRLRPRIACRVAPALDRDVRDVEAADLDGFDAIVHLAALSNDPIGDLNPDWTYDINLDGRSSSPVARKKRASALHFRVVLQDVRRGAR